MNVINGKELRKEKLDEFSKKLNSIADTLKLVVIQVGNDDASTIYINNKKKICNSMGIICEHIKYDDVSEEVLISKIEELNKDCSVTGILVQLPLPKKLDEEKVINAIDSNKDVDGLSTTNIGKLFSGKKGLVPCTSLGVMEILDSTDVNLEGKNVVIVGRSKLVGLPLIKLLLDKNATVTVCHSKTSNLKEKTCNADILIVAVGVKHLIKEDYVKDDVIVIDVGINREGGVLYGDCDFDNIKDKCKYITPVPNGVGPLTVTMLVNNIIEAYYLQKNQ